LLLLLLLLAAIHIIFKVVVLNIYARIGLRLLLLLMVGLLWLLLL
jgi:hypothetical protein